MLFHNLKICHIFTTFHFDIPIIPYFQLKINYISAHKRTVAIPFAQSAHHFRRKHHARSAHHCRRQHLLPARANIVPKRTPNGVLCVVLYCQFRCQSLFYKFFDKIIPCDIATIIGMIIFVSYPTIATDCIRV